jgi:hypothetical protein
MKLSQITISASRTINIGNYNSVKVEGSATVTFDEGEGDELDIADGRELAKNEVMDQLKMMWAELKPKKGTGADQ